MNTKQVIVVRKDLNMRKGKIAAQAAHASMAVFFNQGDFNKQGDFIIKAENISDAMESWMTERFTKICVYVNSEEELLEIYGKANVAGIPASLIRDAGVTEFNGVPTYTTVAIGPDLVEEVDKITGGLPLL